MNRETDIVLPMFGIASQSPLRGSTGCAHTALTRGGQAEAAALLAAAALQLVHGRPADGSYQQATDALGPDGLEQVVVARVAALPVLQPEPMDADSLQARAHLLGELLARNTTARFREVVGALDLVVAERVEGLRRSLAECFDTSPTAILNAVARVRETLKSFVWRQDPAPLQRFEMLVRRLQELPLFEDRLTARAARLVTEHLLADGRSACRQATRAMLRDLAADTWARQEPDLKAALTSLEQQSARYDAHVRAFQEALTAHARQARETDQKKSSSIALRLEGPTAEEVIAGMKTAAGCVDIPGLASQLWAMFELRLREWIAKFRPALDADRASCPALFLGTPASELAGIWLRLIGQRLGGGQSLFKRLEAYGLDAAVEFLWRRAAPTCFLSGFGHERFSMNVTEVAVVRLPLAQSPDDERARGRLVERFHERAPGCHISDGNEDDQEISVCRFNVGWVIGIEQSGLALIQRYAEAARNGHLPHLLLEELLTHSELGRPIPAYLTLATLSTTHLSNGKEHSHEPSV